jgi:transcriptional regulator with GAF, ATPase, and Fis domain
MSIQLEVLQSIRPILTTLAESAVTALDAVGAQAWLTGPGDVCPDCPQRGVCRARSACLHLAAVAGAADTGDAAVRRIPLGSSPLSRVPATRETMIARADLPGQGVADGAWLKRTGVRAIAAEPLVHGERGIGVLVVFARAAPSEQQRRLLSGTARLGAEAIGNMEAYRVLAADRNRLAARNARLRSGLGLPPEPETATPAAPTADRRGRAAPPAAEEVASEMGAMIHAERFTLPPLRSFAQIQREGILHALERAGWRVSGPRGAAVALGLKPTTLESKMKRLGIRRPPR